MGATLSGPCRRKEGASASPVSSSISDGPERPTANFCDEFFSLPQKRLLRKTWAMMQDDLGDKGIKIFMRIFHLAPEAKKLFPFRDAEGEGLLKHPQFKGHGLRFMKAVGVAIDNLDTLDMVLIPNLISLGKTHVKIQGFAVEQFALFVDAMDYVWSKELGKHYTKDTREVWLKLFNLITSTIREGYHEGVKSMVNGKRSSLRPSMTPSMAANMGLTPDRSHSLTQTPTRTPSDKKSAIMINGSGLGPVEFDDIPSIDGNDDVINGINGKDAMASNISTVVSSGQVLLASH